MPDLRAEDRPWGVSSGAGGCEGTEFDRKSRTAAREEESRSLIDICEAYAAAIHHFSFHCEKGLSSWSGFLGMIVGPPGFGTAGG